MIATGTDTLSKATLTLALYVALSAGTIIAMQKKIQVNVPYNYYYQHIVLKENDISSLVKEQLLFPDKTIYHHYPIPLTGASLTIRDNFCYPSRIDLEIKQGTQHITLFRAERGTIKVTNNNDELLAEFLIFPCPQKQIKGKR